MIDEKTLDELAASVAYYRKALWSNNIVGDLADRLVGDYHEMMVSTMLVENAVNLCGCGPAYTTLSV